MEVDSISIDEWEAECPSTVTSVFHRPETLRVVDEHVSGDLQLFVGYNGDRLVGLLPVFSRGTTVGSVTASPPPGWSLPHMGPMLFPASPKQRKREKLNKTFTSSALDRLRDDSSFSLLHLVCLPEHTDPRPFRWAGFNVETLFTYQIDVADRPLDEVRSDFSRSLRREIDSADETSMSVSKEGIEGVRRVFDDCAVRFAEQGRDYPLNWPFMRDLVRALNDRAQAYIARGPDDEYLGGIVVLYSDNTAYFWQGGVRHSFEGVSTNSILHWAILEDLVEEPAFADVEAYDLFGANTARLCEYKSKFGGELVPYYRVESSGAGMSLAKSAYNLVGRLGTIAEDARSPRASSESD